jgi:hypothetical protein
MNGTTLTRLGALLLAPSLIGYAIYELVLLPAAGFPSDDMRVIMGGADTLRVGHWLKFGYGLAIALVVAGKTLQVREATPVLAQLALMAGIAAVTLYIASGMLDLRMWDHQFEPFAKHVRVVRYDLRGFGKSSVPDGSPYCHADDLAALLALIATYGPLVNWWGLAWRYVLGAAGVLIASWVLTALAIQVMW